MNNQSAQLLEQHRPSYRPDSPPTNNDQPAISSKSKVYPSKMSTMNGNAIVLSIPPNEEKEFLPEKFANFIHIRSSATSSPTTRRCLNESGESMQQ